MLLNITCTGDELFGIVNMMTLIDLEPKNKSFSDFWRFLAAKEWIATKLMEIKQDYPQTETAISSPASHEHKSIGSDFLFSTAQVLLSRYQGRHIDDVTSSSSSSVANDNALWQPISSMTSRDVELSLVRLAHLTSDCKTIGSLVELVNSIECLLLRSMAQVNNRGVVFAPVSAAAVDRNTLSIDINAVRVGSCSSLISLTTLLRSRPTQFVELSSSCESEALKSRGHSVGGSRVACWLLAASRRRRQAAKWLSRPIQTTDRHSLGW